MGFSGFINSNKKSLSIKFAWKWASFSSSQLCLCVCLACALSCCTVIIIILHVLSRTHWIFVAVTLGQPVSQYPGTTRVLKPTRIPHSAFRILNSRELVGNFGQFGSLRVRKKYIFRTNKGQPADQKGTTHTQPDVSPLNWLVRGLETFQK